MVTYDSTVTGGNGIAEPAEYELPEGRLALAGATLSRRLENGQGIWRLELPTPSGEPFVDRPQDARADPRKRVELLDRRVGAVRHARTGVEQRAECIRLALELAPEPVGKVAVGCRM